MSWHPLGDLLPRSVLTWTEVEVGWFVQQWLRERLKTELLYCDSLQGGKAEVRVSSAALKQETLLCQPDVVRAVAEQTTYSLQGLIVRISG